MKRKGLLLILLIILLALSLIACGKSKPSQFYILNPINAFNKTSQQFQGLKIGIDTLTIPDYLSKRQLPLFYTANQATVYESHEWAEDLEKNTTRVVLANLTTLLPGSIVEATPWDIKFKPDYTLQIFINQWLVSNSGKSQLQANYIIFNESVPIYQKNITYYQQIPQVNPEKIVVSMNANLTRLTQDVAQSIRSVRKH